MGEKKEEDLYRNFSRKDLQGLCKKYGLPANKSSSEMATSLILYLEKKNISSKTIWEVSRSDPYPSLWPEFQPGVKMSSAGNKRTDLKEMSSQNGFGQLRNHQDPDRNHLQKLKGPACSDKASEDIGLLTQLHRDSNSGAGDAENAFSSVLSSTAEPSLPTFNYDVSCEDGIQLCVDLNSTPSDWIESLNAGVHICDDIHGLKSNSSDERHNNTQLEYESCPTTVGTGIVLQAEKCGGSLPSPVLESCRNTAHNLEDLGEERAIVSSISKYDIEPPKCGSECLTRKDNDVGTKSDASLVTQIRTDKFSGNTVPYDPTCSKTADGIYKEPCSRQTCSPPDPVSKNSKLSGIPFVGIEASPSVSSSKIMQFGSFTPGQFGGVVPQMWSGQAVGQSSCASSSYLTSGLSDVGPQVRIEHGGASMSIKSSMRVPEAQTQKTKPYFPFQRLPLTNANLDTSIETGNGGFISSHEARQETAELPKKDASLSPLNIDGPLHLVIPKKNRAEHHSFSYSNNFDKDVRHCQGRNDLGCSKTSDGNKSSVFNQFRQSTEETCVEPPNSGYNDFKMKRHFNSADDQRQPVSPEAKILRTSNQFSGDARASRRRSMRPFTK